MILFSCRGMKNALPSSDILYQLNCTHNIVFLKGQQSWKPATLPSFIVSSGFCHVGTAAAFRLTRFVISNLIVRMAEMKPRAVS